MLIGTKHSGYSRANIRLYFDPITLMAAGAAIVPEVAALTTAEVIAAEAAAAAAETLAAQQAAAAVAAETAAITAAEAGALQAAQQAAQSGIMQVGGTSTAPLTSEAVQTIAQQSGLPEVASRGIQGVPEAISPAQQTYMEAANAVYNPSNVVSDAASNFGVEGTKMLPQGPTPNFSAVDQLYNNALSQNTNIGSEIASKGSFNPTNGQFTNTTLPNQYQLGPQNTGPTMRLTEQGLSNVPRVDSLSLPNSQSTSLAQLPSAEPKSSLMNGLNSAMDWVEKNKFKAASGAFMGAKALGLLDPSKETSNDDPYDGPLSKYRMSPDFKGRTATPNIYRPTYPTYAAGGIMNAGPVQSMSDQNDAMGYQQAMAATGGQVAHFAKGGNLSDSLDYYKNMMGGKQPKAPNDPSFVNSVGIARDDDPDTRSLDALTAAQIRNAKANKRANLSIPNMKRPTPMGQINLAAPGIKSSAKEDVQEAAAGGIMGASSLGGYAAGGNPRLLRGPGDGMSDNIPAMIGKKQPARLADGEFVIPADVVSHLGNGSTEAGAKRLHEMMNKVRRDRTGNSRQGKQIVASKYMPK